MQGRVLTSMEFACRDCVVATHFRLGCGLLREWELDGGGEVSLAGRAY